MRALAVVLSVLFVTSSGCLFGISDGPDCLGDYLEARRDPRTGACIELGDEDGCAACSAEPTSCIVTDAAHTRKLDYATCGGCPAAGEAACLDLAGCRAVYAGGSYIACWYTAPSGPVSDGACAGLDAHECSRHDNCAAFYVPTGPMSFDHCADEVRPAP